ncbi:MAG: hypothetical protein JWP01_1645 [Myxococcales bacterium]|nr:hypothetical protein [Myxococcales bacterium]
MVATAWADLDKLALARPRPDGRATLIARDDRSAEAITEARHLSTVIAIARVVRGTFAIEERHGGHGLVIYSVREHPPAFLVDAVSAAGGVVFDGSREHTTRSPLATTVQLDAAFSDLASAVRRRLKVGSIGDALDVLEHHVRRRAIPKDDAVATWTAVSELAALAGELIRADRPARWRAAGNERFPLALDLGKGEIAFPGKLAQAIVEGAAGSLRSLVAIASPPMAVPVAPASTVRAADPVSAAYSHPLPLLCDRRTVPIERLTHELLLGDEVDTPDVPVIVYVDDRDDAVAWPQDLGAPTAALRRTALANLAVQPVELTPMDVLIGKVVVVTGGFYAAESILDRATMERVRSELGGPELLLVGIPARGHLVAIDATVASADPELQAAFLMMVEGEYLRALECDRITSEVIVYADKPLGRVQSNLMDTRRALRRVGVDPDA